jgi:hypothetical protein
VQGLFSTAQLEAAAARGDLILVPGDEWLSDMHEKLDKLYPPQGWKVEVWRRWKTKGKNAQGVPAWQEAWASRDLTRLEKNYYMVKVGLFDEPVKKKDPNSPGASVRSPRPFP